WYCLAVNTPLSNSGPSVKESSTENENHAFGDRRVPSATKFFASSISRGPMCLCFSQRASFYRYIRTSFRMLAALLLLEITAGHRRPFAPLRWCARGACWLYSLF